MLAAGQNPVLAEFKIALDSGDPDAVKRVADRLDRDGKDPVVLVASIASSNEATFEACQIALRVLEILDSAVFLRAQREQNGTESIDLVPSDVLASEDPTKWVVIGLILLAILWPAYSIYRFNNPKPAKSSKAPDHSKNSEFSRADAASEKRRIDSDYRFGCSDRGYFEKLASYGAQGDKEAFTRALSAGVALGVCTMFKSREPIFITDTAIFSGLVEIKREGSTQEFWTNIEFID